MPNQDAHVSDVGTVYFVPTYDDDLSPTNFNPSAATVKQLIFKMPGATTLLTRTATAAQKTIAGVAVWGLQYTVLAADVVPGGFHQTSGKLQIEGYVEFSAAQKWTSSTVRTDQQNRTLRIVTRLS